MSAAAAPSGRAASAPITVRVALAAAAIALLWPAPAEAGRRRGGSFDSIEITAPRESELFNVGQGQASLVAVAAETGKNVDPSGIVFRVDAVDLIGALGLTPPFFGAAGTVSIGGALVDVSDFDFDTDGPVRNRIDAVLSGLPPGPHELEVEASAAEGPLVVGRPFAVVEDLGLVAETFDAAGLRDGPEDAGGGSTLAGASLGEAAAGPVGFADGTGLRAGFVDAAEALIAGGVQP